MCELSKKLHDGKTPKEVRSANELHQEFPPAIFATCFHREVRGLRESVFWQAKRNLKGREAHENEAQEDEE